LKLTKQKIDEAIKTVSVLVCKKKSFVYTIYIFLFYFQEHIYDF